jgi:hypothetical protein
MARRSPFGRDERVVTEVTISSANSSRTITLSEVRDWFGKSKKLQLGRGQCSKIAARLTRLRWPSDSPTPTDTFDPEIMEGYWDFDNATKAAKTLLEHVPAMLSHWKSLRPTAESRAGYEAIHNLKDALSTAMPYVEWPFGRYQRQTGRKQPKDWHIYSVLIARLVVEVLVVAGESKPGITHNSLVVRVVHKALIRMDFPNSAMITRDAIGAHLSRWNKRYGLTKRISQQSKP